MSRLFGIETEYGITVDGLSTSEWINESIGVVKNHPGVGVSGWNYRSEDARRDMRGFTVERLATNPEDAQFDPPGTKQLSREEERSDKILANGARFYNDHGHPEYATPECRTLRDLVAHDKAGERIALTAANERTIERNLQVSLYKNNTDYHGASYGTHENYLMERSVPTDNIIQMLLPFFASRPIIAGAGKSGVENEGFGHKTDLYQISQRADYFTVQASVDTLHNRPLVNTRDEPHATPSRYRRLHVICGDANMSEIATALKVGTTSLILRLLEEGVTTPLKLTDPVRACKQISRDITLRQKVETLHNSAQTALDIQYRYLELAEARLRKRDEDTDWVLDEWAMVLDDLKQDPLSTSDRLDWTAKYAILEPFRQEEKLTWNNPHIQSLDLAYHNIDPEVGLYYGLEQMGQMRRLVSDMRIDAAMDCPPENTRAMIRGLFVKRFGSAIRSIGWNGIAFRYKDEEMQFSMNPLVEDNLTLLNEELAAAVSLDDFVSVLQRRPEPVSETL